MNKIKHLQSKPNIHLSEFIETGNFGKIETGNNENDVINYLGNNYEKVILDSTYMLQYGFFEFHFWMDKTLYGIQNDSIIHTYELRNKPFCFDMDFMHPGITLEEAKNILNVEKIKYIQRKYMEHCEMICFESGVFIDFFNETLGDEIIKDRNDFIFSAIRIFAERTIK